MLKFYTGNIRYSGKDRFDVTVKSGHLAFAPTWDIVMGIKQGNISIDQYTIIYKQKLENSYQENRWAWDDLLSRDKVVLVCYCGINTGFCHRYILAEFLVKLGATYLGELPREAY